MCSPEKCTCGLGQALQDDLDNWDDNPYLGPAPVIGAWSLGHE